MNKPVVSVEEAQAARTPLGCRSKVQVHQTVQRVVGKQSAVQLDVAAFQSFVGDDVDD